MKRGDRRDRILDAAATVLAERGFWGCTMRDVARAAGTSAGNLYHYVGGREDLLYQVQRRILDAAIASAEASLAVRGARERLRALLTDHVRRMLARPAEVEVLRRGPGPLRGERARRVEEGRRRYHELVRHAADGVLRGRAGRASDAEARSLMLLGMAERLALEGVRGARTQRPDRLAARALTLWMDGARGRPGTRT